jgi:hypothetical protein
VCAAELAREVALIRVTAFERDRGERLVRRGEELLGEIDAQLADERADRAAVMRAERRRKVNGMDARFGRHFRDPQPRGEPLAQQLLRRPQPARRSAAATRARAERGREQLASSETSSLRRNSWNSRRATETTSVALNFAGACGVTSSPSCSSSQRGAMSTVKQCAPLGENAFICGAPAGLKVIVRGDTSSRSLP